MFHIYFYLCFLFQKNSVIVVEQGKKKYIIFNVNTENRQRYKTASDTFLALDLSM